MRPGLITVVFAIVLVHTQFSAMTSAMLWSAYDAHASCLSPAHHCTGDNECDSDPHTDSDACLAASIVHELQQRSGECDQLSGTHCDRLQAGQP